ncbi:hypothetical protein [Maricaulis sp.]|uniref:hypothetical protein n=1 Tax=Maricaulis sp. TaxID=1486257 RepID=UPI001B2A3763|nr:hypothetical protein [Maricaulis sp.]MBO6766243.1 hypothetical protein [Maricaulis sp.]
MDINQIGVAIAGLSLIGSAVTFVRGEIRARNQKDFERVQHELNEQLLARERELDANMKSADLSANLIKVDKFSYRVRVFNRGATAAKNVRLEVEEGSELIDSRFLKSMFPYEKLDKHQKVDVRSNVIFSKKDKHILKIIWDDDSGNNKRSTVYLSI